MSAWQIFELALWTVVLGVVLIALGQLAQKYRYSSVGMALRPRSAKLVVAFALTNLTLIIWPVSQEWWVEKFFTHTLALLALFGIFGYGMSLMKPNPKTQGRVGFGLASLAFICILYFLGAFDGWSISKGKDHNLTTNDSTSGGPKGGNAKSAGSVTYDYLKHTFPPELAGNEDAQLAFNAIMSEELSGPGLTEQDRYDLFFTCGEESSYTYAAKLNGRLPDGTDNGARGPCQIKPSAWDKRAAELTKDTGKEHFAEIPDGKSPVGHYRLAVALFREEGANLWELWPRVDAMRKLARNNGGTSKGKPETGDNARTVAPERETTSERAVSLAVATKNCAVTQSVTLGVDDPPTVFVVPSPDAVLETSGDGMYVIRGWYRYSNESIAITDAKSDTESQANMAGWQRKIGSFRKVEVQTVRHSADPKPVTYNVRPCQM